MKNKDNKDLMAEWKNTFDDITELINTLKKLENATLETSITTNLIAHINQVKQFTDNVLISFLTDALSIDEKVLKNHYRWEYEKYFTTIMNLLEKE